jgi:predicted  nucleic acid-binding Zn-ribbon protein
MAKQLYLLQELEQEITTGEKAVEQIERRLEGDERVLRLQDKLAQEEKQLEELKQRQHAIEWEVDDIASKLKATEDELYSGRIRNPKELTNLQHEADVLKGKRSDAEDRALEIMEQVEAAEAARAATRGELQAAEAAWQDRRRELSVELEQLKDKLAGLRKQQQSVLDGIDHETADTYYHLKKQKGRAVARVEQGICLGCRIVLPMAEVQRARSGQTVQCSSCGRILYLP